MLIRSLLLILLFAGVSCCANRKNEERRSLIPFIDKYDSGMYHEKNQSFFTWRKVELSGHLFDEVVDKCRDDFFEIISAQEQMYLLGVYEGEGDVFYYVFRFYGVDEGIIGYRYRSRSKKLDAKFFLPSA